jgi:transposase
MRYELTDYEWAAIKPFLPNKPRGVPRVNDRRVLEHDPEARKDLLEYVIVHEMAHLIVPTHSDQFVAILQKHFPTWREARAELNELPLTAEAWNE